MRNLKTTRPAVLAGVALLLGGCFHHSPPDKATMRKAIETRLNTIYPRCYLQADFPARAQYFFPERDKHILHLFAQAGMLKETVMATATYPATSTVPAKQQMTSIYTLTEQGRQFFSEHIRGPFAYRRGGFCFGKAVLLSVDHIDTAPRQKDILGRKRVGVTYTYTITDIPDWLRRPELVALLPQLSRDLAASERPVTESDVYALSKIGWIQYLNIDTY